jgi:hypothetical protein
MGLSAQKFSRSMYKTYIFSNKLSASTFFPSYFTTEKVFWYSGYGGETDVSLNCGLFYGPIVRPRMRMKG